MKKKLPGVGFGVGGGVKAGIITTTGDGVVVETFVYKIEMKC